MILWFRLRTLHFANCFKPAANNSPTYHHRVKDYNSWKPLYDSDLPRRTSAGFRELAVGQKAGDPGNVFIVFEVQDTSAVNNMMSDPGLQKTMQEARVISVPEVTVIE